MNLAKVALYLEYIAFNLRKESETMKSAASASFRAAQEVPDQDDGPPKAPEAAKPASRGTLVSDPELKAMNRIAGLLSGLDTPTRDRVLSWLMDKYQRATKCAAVPMSEKAP